MSVHQRILACSLLGLAGALAGVAAHADQSATSSDGAWKAHSNIAGSLLVKKSSEAKVMIMPGTSKGCPQVTSVAFEMPSHGHGGDVAPKVAAAPGDCTFSVSDLSPSMAGEWRIRLVLKDGASSSNLDIMTTAK
jgi:hypothetical protein